jgi:RNA polymerase sigma factor (sigma-70 family)
VFCANACKRNVDEANDLFQDITYSVWKLWGTVDDNASDDEKDRWLMAKARTVRYNFLRYKRLRWGSGDIDVSDTTDNGQQEIREQIDELLSCLTPDERELIELILKDYNANEIAILKDLKASTVRKRLERIYKKMYNYSKKINS